MNIHLTPELEQFVHAKVQSGRYDSASEVVREALRLMAERDELRAIQIQEFRSRMDWPWGRPPEAKARTARSSSKGCWQTWMMGTGARARRADTKHLHKR